MARLILLALLLASTACESETDEIERLQTREAMAAINVRALESDLDSVSQALSFAHYEGQIPEDSMRARLRTYQDSIGPLIHAARTELDLARRDLNRFVGQ